ncbi:hypothetical protein Tco_0799402 [Tanacetum coccineum]|uniref:Uncharacterized protein n=1 Tax=Tanacetum coccineum TaxID=301880 RepID=A0ABQ4ZQ88_9ASTR
MVLRGTPKASVHWMEGKRQDKEVVPVKNVELLMLSIYLNTGLQLLNLQREPETNQIDPTLEKVVQDCNLAEHVQHLVAVLDTMRKNQLYAKKSKCVFGTSHVEYLDHVISADGIANDSSKIKAV